jgi:hypothetical protein
MKPQNIDTATVYAQIECAQKKATIDLYKVSDGYAWKLKSLRRSGKFEKQLSYENGQVIVRNSKGKVIDTIGDKTKKKAPKEEPKRDTGISDV